MTTLRRQLIMKCIFFTAGLVPHGIAVGRRRERRENSKKLCALCASRQFLYGTSAAVNIRFLLKELDGKGSKVPLRNGCSLKF
jgi:hypothetical protein